MTTVYDREQFLMMCSTRLETKNPACLEIGVLHGDFSQLIHDILKPDLLVLIDPFQKSAKTYNEGLGHLPLAYSTDADYEKVCNRFLKQIKESRVIVDRHYSHEVVLDYPDKTFDVIYLDGSHLQEDVEEDLASWMPKLKKGGLMCGHDYINHESFGVIPAVDVFCKQYNFEMIIYNPNGGDYALRAIQ